MGYPVAVAVLLRWLPVVRHRRWRWLVVHHAGVGAVVAGWALKGAKTAAALNAGWLVAATAWFLWGSRRR